MNAAGFGKTSEGNDGFRGAELYEIRESCTHDHVNIYKDIKDSLKGQFPRRTIEGYEEKYISPGRWSDSAIMLKKTDTMSDLYTLIKPLLDNEDEGDYSVLWDNQGSPANIRV